MPSFLDNFVKRFKEEGHEIDFYQEGQDTNLNNWKLKGLCDWADIIWCEFCQDPMALVTNYVKDKPIIARLWRCEIYNPRYLDSIKWDAVDLLLVATDNLKDRFLKSRKEKLEPKQTKAFYMPSVDIADFKYRDRKSSDQIKMCIVGNILPRKRQLDAVQLMLDLPDSFSLSLVGDFKDKEYVTHIQSFIKGNGLAEKIHVYGKMAHEMLPEFFGDHDVYLSMSVEETAHFAVAESMATGCYPLLNWWPGITDVYPEKFVHRRFASMTASLDKWDKLDHPSREAHSLAARAYAEKNFSADIEYKNIMEDINKILRIPNEDSAHVEVLPEKLGAV